MTTIRLRPKLHPAQLEVHADPARFKVLSTGRRFGKTRLGVNECLSVAMEGGRAWWVAPSYKMGEVGWRPLKRMGVKLGAEIRIADRQILLPNNGEVTIRSADNPDGLRGEGLDFLVMDECAYTQETAWTESLRPALSDKLGRAMFISSPHGRNWFWRLWMRGRSGQYNWKSWSFPTSANPYIDPAEIEDARQSLPELTFEQEYLAEFLESEGAVFRNILACLNAPNDVTIKAHEGHFVVAGLDWGKQNDFTTTSIGCADCRVELARDRFNKIDYQFQYGRISELWKAWNIDSAMVELNSIGEPGFEALERAELPVVGFDTTASSKPPLIENFSLALERTEWQFQADEIWTGELEAYERVVSPRTGRSQYSAPTGMHDDTVMARALMLHAADNRHWTIH